MPDTLHPYEIQVPTHHLDMGGVGVAPRRWKSWATVYCLFATGPAEAATMWRAVRGDRRLCDCKWTCHEFKVRRWNPAEREVDWNPEAHGLGHALTSLGKR